MQWQHTVLVRGARGAGQDRAAVVELPGALVVALADGAGGTSGGARAADAIVAAVTAAAPSAPAWADVLEALDRDPKLGGEATAIALTVTAGGIRGASAGDSIAWLIRDGAVEDLTRYQAHKPLIGGGAIVNELAGGPLAGGTLLVASDGLWKYARRADLVSLAALADLDLAAGRMLALVATGEPWDDVSIVLVRG